MQVETYEQTETDSSGVQECDAEALALIDQLGLSGQQELNRRASDGQTVRNPYRKMTDEELFVYEEILTSKTPIDKYADGPIPTRVLQVAAHARDLFGELQVWHKPNADIKDPVLVGCIPHPEYSWQKQRFMLARWGEVLEPFSDLRQMACQIRRRRVVASCKTAIAKATARLSAVENADLDTMAASDFNSVPTYHD